MQICITSADSRESSTQLPSNVFENNLSGVLMMSILTSSTPTLLQTIRRKLPARPDHRGYLLLVEGRFSRFARRSSFPLPRGVALDAAAGSAVAPAPRTLGLRRAQREPLLRNPGGIGRGLLPLLQLLLHLDPLRLHVCQPLLLLHVLGEMLLRHFLNLLYGVCDLLRFGGFGLA